MTTVLRVAYDGTDFHGFARQPNFRTVQGTLEAGLERVYKQALLVRGASRTDAGVHANGQLVAFEAPFEIPPAGLAAALLKHLPRDLVVKAVWSAHGPDGERYEPRFQNGGKHYVYRIRCAPYRDPLFDRYEWHLGRSLDVASMRDAAQRFVGRHDFAAFRASDCQATTTVRRVTEVEVSAADDRRPAFGDPFDSGRPHALARVVIDVRGEAFLKNMVRIMVGTLIGVGRGRYAPPKIDELLASSAREDAGPTAPARGLTLEEVRYLPEGVRPSL